MTCGRPDESAPGDAAVSLPGERADACSGAGSPAGMRNDRCPIIDWEENGRHCAARWRSEGSAPLPKRVRPVDDALPADTSYRLACEGTALLWRGDFQNARQLLKAIARRVDARPPKPGTTMAETFHRYRQAQARRARILGMLLIPLSADHGIPLRRAPDVGQACREAFGPGEVESVVSLPELQGVIGAYEWRRNGVKVPALNDRIYPWFGVFSPTRGEYVDLVARAPLREPDLAFDIGTGTGVLAAILIRRGAHRVVATDKDPRSVDCARDNLARLGMESQAEVMQVDLFPQGRAQLIVCNPPWIPSRPVSPIERAIFDPDSRMLRGVLAGAATHLAPRGEAWLILSDLAEHLGLRSREQLLSWMEAGNLVVLDSLDIRPRHPKAGDAGDPLHEAREKEVTSLWRLAARTQAGGPCNVIRS